MSTGQPIDKGSIKLFYVMSKLCYIGITLYRYKRNKINWWQRHGHVITVTGTLDTAISDYLGEESI